MIKKKDFDNGGFVFSTKVGELCPKCGKAIHACICKELANTKKHEGDGIVRLMRETKGRKGAGVTLIKGICLSNNELKTLAKELKKKCGCGGSLKEGVIEIQGDVRIQIKDILEKKNFKVKICGG